MQSSSTDSHRRQSPIIAIFRVTAGNFLEQFDFFLFGFYATQIAAAFFPLHSEFASLISTFAVFGAGFLMRPLGAVFLGAYIDDVGRRKGLIMTLGLMASGTVLITFVPRYSTIGLLAPALVLIGRLLQGFAAGAELGGVSVYLAELASPGKKGFYTSWQSASQQLSIVVAASLGFALNRLMDAAAVAAWGWRIPFFVGCLVVPFVFMLRYKLEETEEFKRRETRPAMHDVIRTLAANWKVVVAGAMQVAMTTTSFYLITVYAPTFGRTALRLGTADSLLVTVYVGLSNFIWLPISGALSDRVGRRPLLLSTTVLALATAYPALSFLADAPTFGRMLAVLLWLSFLYSMYNGAMVVSLEEVMPPEVRVAGFSLAYSAATALFGGFTPAISTALIHATHDNATPAWWLSFAAACAFFGTLALCRHKPASVNPSSARESRSVPRP
ncbi:MHS family citrate/tricarballylate:H+ symporter-like MFS transporter [Paraburkholderia sp. RAU2J]|uniref:MFS transporter n=1 Tax=Paraburkholderia sp. RAU2J TaxID=1938810 RepID=UPI000EAD65AD|nr:MFS transporter [Paraburkholderia sp. RAU2J]RKT22101.1 MHS family citrate/tricarballylate:H+ symporter-like MFS transporter [Paraburkholderia sp. RAU2J]